MTRALGLLLLAVLMGSDALAQARLPEGLRPAAAKGVYTWKLPGDAGELEMVAVTSSLWIGRTEVTAAQFAGFAAATRTPVPEACPGAGPDHPVVNVTWDEARAFCAWAGLELPRVAEWEQAAGGPYPWGKGEGPEVGNFCDASCPEDWEWKDRRRDDGAGTTAPVGRYPKGVAPCGALDLGGNAWEWCADAVEGGARAAKGGGWCSPVQTARRGAGNAFPEDTRWGGLGLRPVLRAR